MADEQCRWRGGVLFPDFSMLATCPAAAYDVFLHAIENSSARRGFLTKARAEESKWILNDKRCCCCECCVGIKNCSCCRDLQSSRECMATIRRNSQTPHRLSSSSSSSPAPPDPAPPIPPVHPPESSSQQQTYTSPPQPIPPSDQHHHRTP